jgi:hypothetical protein
VAPTTTVSITTMTDNVGLLQGNVTSGATTNDTSLVIGGTLGGATAGASLASGETLRIYDAVTPTLVDVVRRHGATRLVDLCSGGGGPVLRLQRALHDAGAPVDVVLTVSISADRISLVIRLLTCS